MNESVKGRIRKVVCEEGLGWTYRLRSACRKMRPLRVGVTSPIATGRPTKSVLSFSHFRLSVLLLLLRSREARAKSVLLTDIARFRPRPYSSER